MANNYVWGVCGVPECRSRNYRLHKGPKVRYKLKELSKYCRHCHKHTPHKEVK